jgi:endoglucanase
VDNDADGLIDFPNDPGCGGATDNDETDPLPAAQCDDGVDNDSDGLIDFPDDPGCNSVDGNNEKNPPPRSVDLSQGEILSTETGSLEPFTLLLLFCVILASRRRTGVS